MFGRDAEKAGWRSLGRGLRREHAIFALLAVLALFTRFWAIDKKSLWLDEAVSWQFANASLTDMFDLITHGDVHPPLYYGVLHYWLQLAGDSEASLRAPSAIFGAATIVLVAVVAWRVGGWLLALSASALLLSNGVYLAATQEARMYPLVSLLTLGSSVALARFIAKPSLLRFVPYAALDIGLVYTHYSGFIAIAAQGLVFAVYGLDAVVRKRNAWIIFSGLVLVAVLVVAYIPWWSTFLAHPRPGGAGGYPQPSVAFVTDTGRSALGLDEAGDAWLVLALPLLLLGVYALAKRWRDPRVLAVGAIALVPVGQILVSICFEPVLDARQAGPYLPGLAFVLALGFVEAATFAGHVPRLVPAAYTAVAMFGLAMLVIMALRVQQTYTAPPRQDWRSVAADLAGSSEPIYIAPGYQWRSLEYYRGTSFNVTPLWQADLRKIAGGAAPVAPDKLDTEAILIVQGGAGQAAVPSFERYFVVEGMQEYSGKITTYSLQPISGGD